ncbi:hypothetical protein OBP_048 [Pseudomonas phage OBP]|uniref:hypothetical protein n=1 Tax=Pseudomonas phage OBP TaxID=1124849 RepID=UPI000240D62D|nr:hypothetical protein OBP_048 [Pseudomonas phage OBP]AEV89485.1 hypothetical protein OBP_048 [Pseudomonas phage OBP]
MRILFNLASYRTTFNVLSQNDVGVAESILTKVCLDNGFPVKPGFFDRNLSFNHTAVYEQIRECVEERLFLIPTPDIAELNHLGNLQFSLTLQNRE